VSTDLEFWAVARSRRGDGAHTLNAAVLELSSGRVLPIEVRRAARHVMAAIQETAASQPGYER